MSTKSIAKEGTLYQRAKAAFRRTAIPSQLIGRESERERMISFWKDHVLANQPGCLYISGKPGTGKTAMLNEMMRSMQQENQKASHQIKLVNINCMSMKEPKQIYEKLIQEISPKKSTPLEVDVAKQAQDLIDSDKHTLSVVVLDEIDYLKTKDQDVLYKLFEWTSLPQSQLVLIGISNALDLTDRILPRLRAKNCEPILLNFNSYGNEEIQSIIKGRLYSLVEGPVSQDTHLPLIQPIAIKLIASKVAGSASDVRTALDICLKAIEIAEAEQKKKPEPTVLGEIKANIPSHNPPAEPKVTIAHVSKVLKAVSGKSSTQKLKELRLHEKIALGVLLVMHLSNKGTKKNQSTLRDFKEQYVKSCGNSTHIPTVSSNELNDILNGLETKSLVTLSKTKDNTKVQLGAQEKEILDVINESSVLKAWMEEAIQG
ncbi:P-loop containing nucleoside triphosphate hydrolase protein [Blakeslea trispora]|nr:P-loop containing nucleoside triphosphate hydrolase protein [Blakeslea trispora]